MDRRRTNPRLTESPAPSVYSLTDDLLAAILIRLRTLNDIGHAACAWSAFRRVIADKAFRRRVRASHPPLLLGVLTSEGAFRPADPPYPSAPAARAVARAADFRLPPLPSPGRWEVRDARDGRALLCRSDGAGAPPGSIFAELAVWDPLFRRFMLLPPIPDHLAAAVQQEQPLNLLPSTNKRFEVFLVPLLGRGWGQGQEEEKETSFTVVWMAQCPAKIVTLVFSSASGQWRAGASSAWKDLVPAVSSVARPPLWFRFRSYAYGCFYWLMLISGGFLVLDMARMEFSLLNYPPDLHLYHSAIAEAGDGRLGMFRLVRGFHLETFSRSRANQGEGATNEWKCTGRAALP